MARARVRVRVCAACACGRPSSPAAACVRMLVRRYSFLDHLVVFTWLIRLLLGNE